MMELVKRYEENPILTYKDYPGAVQVYNAAAVKFKGQYLLLLTVLTDAPIPTLHVAKSDNGVDFTIEEQPLITAAEGEDWICDPRITLMGDTYYILYWAGDKFGVRTVLITTKDFCTINKQGYICEPDNRNMALFSEKINGLYARLDRPYGLTNNGSIWISYSPDLVYWGNSKPIMNHGKTFQWDGLKVGPSATPIKTDRGWLCIYHGVRDGYYGYYLGAMVLDLADPSKIIGRLNRALFSPREQYELLGVVPNSVFCCGVIPEDNGELKIYYSGGDYCLSLATADIDTLVDKCLEENNNC